MRHAYGNANGDARIHSDGDCDGNSNLYAYAYRYGHVYAYRDSYGDIHANSNGYGNIYAHGNCYGDSYRDGNSNTNCDRTVAAYTNPTAASPLAFFGIRGTRENELASSQPPEDRLLLKALPN